MNPAFESTPRPSGTRSAATEGRDAGARPGVPCSELDWTRAAHAPWDEAVRDPIAQPAPSDSNERNYLENQSAARTRALTMFRSLMDADPREAAADVLYASNPTIDSVIASFVSIHRALRGDRRRHYSSPTADGTPGEHESSLNRFMLVGSEPPLLPAFQHALSTAGSLRDRIERVADVYESLVTILPPYLFPRGNHAFGMTLVNGLLRLHGLQGVPHGNDDQAVYGGFEFVDRETKRRISPQRDSLRDSFLRRVKLHNRPADIGVTLPIPDEVRLGDCVRCVVEQKYPHSPGENVAAREVRGRFVAYYEWCDSMALEPEDAPAERILVALNRSFNAVVLTGDVLLTALPGSLERFPARSSAPTPSPSLQETLPLKERGQASLNSAAIGLSARLWMPERLRSRTYDANVIDDLF